MSTDIAPAYSPSRTLSIRVELIRQVRRRRTFIAYLIAVALPIVVVAAVKFGPQAGTGPRGLGDGDLDVVGLATAGPWNFTLTMMLFASGFLLTIFAAMFLGDTVASEASWSTMRYLLVAPVPRRRLLRVKAVVGLLLTLGVLLTLVITSFVIGWIAFGGATLTSPIAGPVGAGESWQRLGIVVGYIGLQLLIPAGIAFLMSVLTDVPLGAVGAAVVIVIVANIVDALDALGDLRRLLPTDYGNSWAAALAPQIDWTDMAIGSTYAVVTFIVLAAIAVLRFERKDILS